jgi:hypothetical protein
MRLEPLISHTGILMTFYLSIILDLQNFFHKGDKYVIDEELQHTDQIPIETLSDLKSNFSYTMISW